MLVVVAIVAGVGALMIPRGSTAQPEPALAGTILPAKRAPQFRLRDQFGSFVSLAQFKGRPVVVTFIEAHCGELCPVVAEKLRQTLQELGPEGRRVVILALSADPEGDTPAAVRQFSQKHAMLHRWLYLTGSRKELTPIWRSYYVFVAPTNAPPALRDSHTSVTYLIDGEGRWRVILAGDPDSATLRRDLLILSGSPLSLPSTNAVPAPQVGHPGPDFTLRSLNGSIVRLSDLRHRVVLLNFWATWCKACKSEMPMLAEWYRRFKGRGFVVLGVDQQESRTDVAAFAGKLHIPYPILIDRSGDLSARYDVAGLPTSLVIDQHGRVTAVRPGILDRAFLLANVQPLL